MNQRGLKSGWLVRQERRAEILNILMLYDAYDATVFKMGLYDSTRLIRIRAKFMRSLPTPEQLDHLGRVLTRVFGQHVQVELHKVRGQSQEGWEKL